MKFAKNTILFVIILFLFSASAQAQLKIMPLGDSITQGELLVTSSTGQPIPFYKPDRRRGLTADGKRGVLAAGNGGYRLPLEDMLAEMGWDFEMVGRRTQGGGHHEGYPGYMTTDILPMLPEMLEVNDPDVVLLHIGTNDLPEPIDAEECYENILEMLDIIHDYNRDIEVVLAQIIPCLQNTELGVERYPEIIRLNDLLTDAPESRSYVSLVDMWTPFVETPGWESELMSDSWHPNGDGYYLMAEIWQDELDHVIHGRAPYIASVNPESGYIFESDFEMTLEGQYFRKGIEILLLPESGDPLEAQHVEYDSQTRVRANFDLTAGTPAQWQVQAINSNKMRSIFSPDVYFTIKPNQFLLSGTVQNSGQPLSQVEMTLAGAEQQFTTATDADGYFEFTDIPGQQDYTLSAYRPGFHLHPALIEIPDLHTDQHNLNFTAEPISVSGEILAGSTPVTGARVHFSGAKDTTLETDAKGKFSLKPAPAGNLTLTPEKPYWEFEPQTITLELDTSDTSVDFAGTYQPPFYAISGQFFDQETAREIPGVQVNLTGFVTKQVVTDSLGFFKFDSLQAFENYTLLPSHPDYQFLPARLHLDSLKKNEVLEFEGDYIATAKWVSGNVRDRHDNPVSGILLKISGDTTQQVLTDENGNYLFANLPPRRHYAIRSASRWVKFQPDSIVVESLEENLAQQDFTVLSRLYPPQIVNLNAAVVDEGSTFPPINLREHVQDADSDPGEIYWWVENTAPLQADILATQICQVTPPDSDWYGEKRMLFFAQDPDGLVDSAWVDFKVKNVNDPPRQFHLADLAPVRANENGRYVFTWHAASDPDSADQVAYTVLISPAAEIWQHPLLELPAESDTSLETGLRLARGEYAWSVRASDGETSTLCAETGVLQVGKMTVARETAPPTQFALHPNYPNPFNPTTVIAYELPRAETVKITIFDELGQEVIQLHHGPQAAGRYQLVWNARNRKGQRVSSGIYFCKMQCPDFVKTVEMSLVK